MPIVCSQYCLRNADWVSGSHYVGLLGGRYAGFLGEIMIAKIVPEFVSMGMVSS